MKLLTTIHNLRVMQDMDLILGIPSDVTVRRGITVTNAQSTTLIFKLNHVYSAFKIKYSDAKLSKYIIY